MDKETARRFDSLEKSIYILRESLSSDTLRERPKQRNRIYIGQYIDEIAEILLKEKPTKYMYDIKYTDICYN